MYDGLDIIHDESSYQRVGDSTQNTNFPMLIRNDNILVIIHTLHICLIFPLHLRMIIMLNGEYI